MDTTIAAPGTVTHWNLDPAHSVAVQGQTHDDFKREGSFSGLSASSN